MTSYDEWKLASPPEEQDKICPCCGSTNWEYIYQDRRGFCLGCSDCIETKEWCDVDEDDLEVAG